MYKDAYDEILSTVEVFCARSQHHYGFGLTPEQAFAECKRVGADAKELKNGPPNARGVLMDRLPGGTVRYAVDNMGSLHWRFAEGAGDPGEGTLTRLVWDKKNLKWIEGVAEKPK